jgi:hypothetical protein
MLADYTTFDEIRAALGVSDEEITDETLGLEIHEIRFEEDLRSLSTLALSTWLALPGIDSRSTAEVRFGKLLKLYATYSVAYALTDSAELFGFLKVADGRASTERTAQAFANLRGSLAGRVRSFGDLMLEALSVIVPDVPAPTGEFPLWVSAVGGATDPVTDT